jgi:hypothetical protein
VQVLRLPRDAAEMACACKLNRLPEPVPASIRASADRTPKKFSGSHINDFYTLRLCKFRAVLYRSWKLAWEFRSAAWAQRGSVQNRPAEPVQVNSRDCCAVSTIFYWCTTRTNRATDLFDLGFWQSSAMMKPGSRYTGPGLQAGLSSHGREGRCVP